MLLALATIVELIYCVIFLQLTLQRREAIYLYFSIFTGIALFWNLGTVLMLFGEKTSTVYLGYWFWLIAPMFSTLFILFFCQQFIKNKIQPIYFLGLVFIVIYALFLAINNNLIDIEFSTQGINSIIPNKLFYIFYGLFFAIYFDISIFTLRQHSIQKDRAKYLQAKSIVYATGFTGTLAVFTNIVLPALGITKYVWMGPIFSLVFLSFSTVAITKYKLLDIRGAILRSTSYVFTVVSLAFVLSVVLFGVLGRTTLFSNFTFAQWTVISLIMAIFSGIYAPLQKFFDKISSRYFYRDAYDPADLLNELNTFLVSSIDLDKIIHDSSEIIEKYLKPRFVIFNVYESENTKKRSVVTADSVTSNSISLDPIYKIANKLSSDITTFSGNDSLEGEVKKLAIKQDIELVSKIASTSSKNEIIGSIVLGSKKNGGLFNRQDLRVIKIISDELAIAIQNALRFEEIQQFNITLQKKVDDATKELRKANEKLIALDQTKDDFISMASHQLRTPLTSVKGYISMVIEGDVGKITKQQHKLLDQAFLSSQRMVYLIADLLNVSRLKTGKFIIEPKPTNLADLIEGELSQLTETAKSRNLTLNYKKPDNFPLFMLDDTKIRQVVMNFADNAIYYTPIGGKIDVNIADTGKTIEFTVTDNGIGVPKNERHNLFSKFYRANNAKKARPDGTGLGLFMAKKVIIAQGGAIIFKSEEGKGSTFGFSFDKEKIKVPEHIKQQIPKKA